jgi:hypothetical protein
MLLAKGPVELEIDLLPEEEVTGEYCVSLMEASSGKTSAEVFGGMLPVRVLAAVLAYSGFTVDTEQGRLSETEVKKIFGLLKNLRIPVEKMRDLKDAQVSLGGVSCGQVDPLTGESLVCGGLHILGEAVDFRGGCGGYNIHWAAVSAFGAAGHIASGC